MIFEEFDFPRAIWPNPIASNYFCMFGLVSAPVWVWSIYYILAELDLTEFIADLGF